MSEVVEVEILSLIYEVEDDWLRNWQKRTGYNMDTHPIYLALRGDVEPLQQWCRSRGDIWVMERLDLVLEVFKSLICYGQLQPIEITKDKVIITGHKRCSCLLLMGKRTVKAVVK